MMLSNSSIHRFRFVILLFCVAFRFLGSACTIVAVSGSVTIDGRPLLLKNRDSSSNNLILKIEQGHGYTYFCQCVVSGGVALSGYNETGFAIVESHSYNMPNSSDGWNTYIMKLALERCSTVDEFQNMLDSLPKPKPITANYGVMDTQGNVAIFEVNEYTYARFDANSIDGGYLIRTNFSFSQDTTGVGLITPSSLPRYQIASAFLEETVAANGFISKENLLGLTRCLENKDEADLCDIAPLNMNTCTLVDFRNYVPRYISTSAMVIQGVLSGENPSLTTAWTTVGPPLSTVTIPCLITPERVLPEKVQLGEDGHSWLCYYGQQLKNSCFVNTTTLDLAKLYNQVNNGVLQRIICIEEDIMELGNGLVGRLRTGDATVYDVAAYYSWVDYYLEHRYNQCFVNNSCAGCDILVDTVYVIDTSCFYVHDTIFDTLWMPLYDTIWLTDTVFIHDTVFITPSGDDKVNSEKIMLYQRDGCIWVENSGGGSLSKICVYDDYGRLLEFCAFCDEPKWYYAVPSSGVYLVVVGRSPAQKIVVVK